MSYSCQQGSGSERDDVLVISSEFDFFIDITSVVLTLEGLADSPRSLAHSLRGPEAWLAVSEVWLAVPEA